MSLQGHKLSTQDWEMVATRLFRSPKMREAKCRDTPERVEGIMTPPQQSSLTRWPLAHTAKLHVPVRPAQAIVRMNQNRNLQTVRRSDNDQA